MMSNKRPIGPLPPPLLLLLLLLLLLPPQVTPRTLTGTIDTASSWQFLDRFVFHNNDDAADEAAVLSAVFTYHRDTRLSLLVYFNSKADASRGTGNPDQSASSAAATSTVSPSAAPAPLASAAVDAALRAANLTVPETKWTAVDQPNVFDSGVWKDIYNSGMPCMWRDRQARRWGNAFSLHKSYEFVSKDGLGFPDDPNSRWAKRSDLITTKTSTETIALKANENVPATSTTTTVHQNNATMTETTITIKVTGSPSDRTKTIKTTTIQVQSEELYPFRATKFFANVAARSPKWFYMVLSNCLESRSASEKELVTGVSSDPNYEVTSSGTLRCTTNMAKNTFCQGPLNRLRYRMTMRNGKSNISYDHDGEKEVVTAFLVLYLGLLGYLFFVLRSLSKKKRVHHAARLLFASVVLQTVAHIFNVNYWQTLVAGGVSELKEKTVRGEHSPREIPWWEVTRVLANFCSVSSQCMLLLVCILIGKGWTVTRRKISAMGRVRLTA